MRLELQDPGGRLGHCGFNLRQDLEQLPSQRSFFFAAAFVIHCMFCGASIPQHSSGQM